MNPQRQRTTWTDDRFQRELGEAIQVLTHFPSNSELRALGRLDLANQIARRGGFVSCANEFGVARLHSDSDTGWMGEKAAAAKLQELGFVIEKPAGVKCPFDLLVNAVLRVDVKAARLHSYRHSCGWFYRIGKHPPSDVILLWQLDTDEFYAVPWFACPHTNVTITRDGGRYAMYRNNTGLIREMVSLREHERCHLFSDCAYEAKQSMKNRGGANG